MALRIDSQIGNPVSPSRDPAQPKSAFPRNGHLNLDTFSPVNENGSFAFDQVVKRGKVMRRSKNKHAFKASWKPGYLVLRPNLLSLYKDAEEAELQLSISLSDVTAVALVKGTKSKREHVFGIFSPSKNYRFQAASEGDAENWVERIRNESCPEYDSLEEYSLAKDRRAGEAVESASENSECDGHKATSPVDSACMHSSRQRPRQYSHTQDYSGNEITAYSDFSDAGGSTAPQHSTSSLPRFDRNLSPSTPTDRRPSLPRNTSQQSDGASATLDAERVVYHGYLLCLKSKKGVRQWKKLWVVLRTQSICFYKDEQEYAAVKIIPMPQVINAAEIDPVSKSKNFCLQIIAEDKTYRFSAPSEEELAKWLGALKSVLAKRPGMSAKPATGSAVAGPSS
ncbi:hypothetical protein FQN52_004120 [Onygenales sp. PD_12]|nr:hypothetical protein FQN51_004450 [Onygenales sp. PD_10]KAK2790490.1 hypothetical protein FQN53_009514 [Emmonsiellopsis sp. PD_33]KAK2792014.1 hypothetical protein FQN52_004120 [Onygenales sp. PD_12]